MPLRIFFTNLLLEKGVESVVLARDDPVVFIRGEEEKPESRRPKIAPTRNHSWPQEHKDYRFEASPGRNKRRDSSPPKCPRRKGSMGVLSASAGDGAGANTTAAPPQRQQEQLKTNTASSCTLVDLSQAHNDAWVDSFAIDDLTSALGMAIDIAHSEDIATAVI